MTATSTLTSPSAQLLLNKQSLQLRILKLMLDYPRAPIMPRTVAYKLNETLLDSSNALTVLNKSGLITYNTDLCHYHITARGKETAELLIKQTHLNRTDKRVLLALYNNPTDTVFGSDIPTLAHTPTNATRLSVIRLRKLGYVTESAISTVKITPTGLAAAKQLKGETMTKESTQTKTALGTPVTNRGLTRHFTKYILLTAMHRLGKPATAREIALSMGAKSIRAVHTMLNNAKHLGLVSADKTKGHYTLFSLTDNGRESITPHRVISTTPAPTTTTTTTPTPTPTTPPESAPTLQDLAAAALAPTKQKAASNLRQVLVQKTETYTMKLTADAPAIHITKEQYDLIKDSVPQTGTASVGAETTYSLATLDGKLVAITREQYEQLMA